MPPLGSHCLLELYGCPPALLDDEQAVLAALREAARRAEATLLGEVSHRFHPHGVTALGLLAESHIAIHTWPEAGYAACDVLTCGERARPELACRHLAEAMQATRHALKRVVRGQDAPGLPSDGS